MFRGRKEKIVMFPIEDICDFSMKLYRWIRGGSEMDELYSLFDNQEPFQYKILIREPDEEAINRCLRVLSHKMAIADKIYSECREILHFDQVNIGDTVLSKK